jgi:hypothetical protein
MSDSSDQRDRTVKTALDAARLSPFLTPFLTISVDCLLKPSGKRRSQALSTSQKRKA